jgi:hypothetical protein
MLGSIAFLMLVTIAPVPAQSGQEKVTICHFPPGNPANARTIVVGAPAVPAHIALHGDTLGACDDHGGER